MSVCFYKAALLALLACFCLGAGSGPLPLSGKGGQKAQFGQTYRELASSWQLAAWPEELPPFHLLPYGVFSRAEILVFGEPFLCRFYFDQPNSQGKLLAVEMVHWEKGHSRRALKAEAGFVKAMLAAYGARQPVMEQDQQMRLTSYAWPGVTFSLRHDESGQTWYLTLHRLEGKAPLLQGLPVGRSREELAASLALEPYFEPHSTLPALSGPAYSLDLSCSPLALRAYYLFAGYKASAPLIGVRLVLESAAAWRECLQEQLKQALDLQYGKAHTPRSNHFVWRDAQGSLSLRLLDDQTWILEFLAGNYLDRLSRISGELGFPEDAPDILGWGQLKWNMSPSRALDLYPQIEKNSYARAGGQGSFFLGSVNFININHKLRLVFAKLGLQEIILEYNGGTKISGSQTQFLRQTLEKEFGPSDWHKRDSDATIYYWSRPSGYIELACFDGQAWRIVFKQRPLVVQ